MRIGYARVSTTEQVLDLQINALEKAGCELIYLEKKSALKHREELQKMMQYVRKGDIVIVWKLDRLARSLKHLLTLIDELKEKGVGFVSLSDNIDTESPLGEFFLQITGAFSQLERNLIVERTKAGLQAAVERGVKLGRKKGVSDESHKKIVAACNLYNNGEMKSKEICVALNISTATLYRYLRQAKQPLRNNYGRPPKRL